MVAKVCSWCGSRLGASAAMAASSTPPRRGVSGACAAAGVSTIRIPIRRARASRMSVLREPDVLELLIGEVARRSHPVFHLGPVHDVAGPPQTGDVVGLLQQDLLHVDDQLAALDRVERPRLSRVQGVDRGVGEAGPVLRGPGY